MSANIDLSGLTQTFSKVEREHLPRIQADAVNRAAEYTRDVLTATIPKVFDNPVSFTRRAVFLTRYVNKNGPYVRDVFLRDEATKGTPPVKYLAPNVDGSNRRVKRFERALRSSGALGPSEWAVPAKSYKLNAYGNISSGVYTRILSQLRASPDPLQNAPSRARTQGARRSKTEYFTVRAGSPLPLGIYQRTGSRTGKRGEQIVQRGVKPVLVFTKDSPDYKRLFQFREIARREYVSEFVKQFRLSAELRLGRAV